MLAHIGLFIYFCTKKIHENRHSGFSRLKLRPRYEVHYRNFFGAKNRVFVA